ncbi:MAG: type II toxin-antitoxin system VapC family toxin [Coriobacteriales bacterium]|jgi:PIN domain nuclease of toxin-antitoxin system|nr:type II toxin-antitoxin system VapC family toxin [Coriobacteriales bacterium]
MSLNYLADTHILIWAINQPRRVSREVSAILHDDLAVIYYSPVSLWEIAIKHGLGKLDLLGHSPEEFLAELENSFFVYKPLDPQTLISSYRLAPHHRDPFDRMLFWEAIRNDLVLLSAGARSKNYTTNGLRVVH